MSTNIDTLLPCPFCGKEPPDDLVDTLYPSGTYWREHKGGYRSYHSHKERQPGDKQCWQIVCAEIYGGCCAEMHADSQEEVIQKWNCRTLAASKPEPKAQAGEPEVKPLLPDDPLLHQTHLPPDWKGRCESACEKWPDCLCANLQKPMTTEELRIKSLQTEIEVLDENLAKKDAALKALRVAAIKCAAVIRTRQQKCDDELTSGDVIEAVYALDSVDAAITQAQEAQK